MQQVQDRFRFRAWSRKTEEMFHNAEQTYDNLRGVLNRGSFDEVLADKDYIVEQCTGLKDKNGRLIYEGDILEVSHPEGEKETHAVEWCGDSDYPAFDLPYLGQQVDCNGLSWALAECEVKVVGNIHENPELLEDKK